MNLLFAFSSYFSPPAAAAAAAMNMAAFPYALDPRSVPYPANGFQRPPMPYQGGFVPPNNSQGQFFDPYQNQQRGQQQQQQQQPLQNARHQFYLYMKMNFFKCDYRASYFL